MSTEWLIDKHNRKYRVVGKNCIEYAPTINTTCGTFYENEVLEVTRKLAKDKEKQWVQAHEEPKNAHAKKYCPFISSTNPVCREDECGLFVNKQCCIAALSNMHGTEQIEKRDKRKCPFSIYRKCDYDCALYNHGCGLVGLAAISSRRTESD